ncbi:protein SRC2 homolog [Ziziphus jujuba]|uniref:Protein SRC2 homolog n=1 Tax=Ziziphus jujuba TaxID=326968 RepID=A0A6P3ZA45_ZIZJJ|nr:protein SRC2 homolog [Ziziphus jujuba]
MEYRSLDINVTCLEGFQVKNLFFKRQKIYATVSIVGSSRTTQKTPVGKFAGSFQRWDYPMRFYIEESMLQENCLMLMIRLRSIRTLCRDKDVGEVYVPIKQLFLHNDHNSYFGYQVHTPSGKPKGRLHFSYKFSDTKRSSSLSTSKAVIENVNLTSPPPSSEMNGLWNLVR